MNKYYSTTVIYKKVSSMTSYHLIKKILNKYLKYSILNQE